MAAIVVTTAFDTVNAGDGVTSLREAIAEANGNGEADIITFAGGLDGSTITLVSGVLLITSGPLIIDADSDSDGDPDITINAGGASGHFIVTHGAAATLDGLTLENGVGATTSGTPGYGAILNRGTLTVQNSVLTYNIGIGAEGEYEGGPGNEGGPGQAAGGGIVNFGTLTVTGSTFLDNQAFGGAGGDGGPSAPDLGYRGGQGGAAAAGILNMAGGVLDISASVFQNQTVEGGAGGNGGDDGFPGYAAGNGGDGGAGALGIVNYGTLTGAATTSGGTINTAAGGPPGTGDSEGSTGANGLTVQVALSFGTESGDTPSGFNGDHTYFGLGGDDDLTGGSGADLLFGGEENDTLDGGSGDDELDGGGGDDSILFGAGGQDTHFGGSGTDTIVTIVSFVSGAQFDLEAGLYQFVGNGFQEIWAGFENYDGTQSDGVETVRGTLENNVLLGGSGAQTFEGRGGNDTLEGNGGNDTLDGGADADTLTGGTGDDTYVNPAGDSVIEAAGAGGGTRDLVRSAASYNLASAPNVEDITLTGAGNFNAIGSTANNRLTGNTGKNILNGGGGNDFLAGLGGIDTLNGGQGNDIYVNPESIDIIGEAAGIAGGLHDRIQTLSSFNLNTVANIEDITLVGGNHVNAIGDNFANILIGNNGNNTINGGGGADTITGGAGNDTMNGGNGADLFKFAAANTNADRIDAFSATQDRFDLSGGSFSNAAVNGADTVLTHSGGTVRIVGVTGLSLVQWNALVVSGGRVAPDSTVPAARGLDIDPYGSGAGAWHGDGPRARRRVPTGLSLLLTPGRPRERRSSGLETPPARAHRHAGRAVSHLKELPPLRHLDPSGSGAKRGFARLPIAVPRPNQGGQHGPVPDNHQTLRHRRRQRLPYRRRRRRQTRHQRGLRRFQQ